MDRPSKKEEVKTYKKLGLGRDHKSRAGLRRIEEGGLYIYIGGDAPDRPHIKVPRKEYLRIWQETHRNMMKEAGEIAQQNPSAFADALSLQVDRNAYEILARRQQAMEQLSTTFRKQHGRAMTPHEETLFLQTLELHDAPVILSGTRRAAIARRRVLDEVMHKIMQTNEKSVDRLQQVWKTVVGEEAAKESVLEKIDPQQGLAICRCLNTTLAFRFRQQRNLATKLAQALGLNIKKIVFR